MVSVNRTIYPICCERSHCFGAFFLPPFLVHCWACFGDRFLKTSFELCSNLRYSCVTCIILSNSCNFFPACLIYSPFVALSIFVTLSIFRRLIKLLSFSHPLLSIHLLRYLATYKCTCCTHHKHHSQSCLIARTLSAPIHLFNSPGVFGHRAILTMGGGGSRHGSGFSRRKTCNLQPLSRKLWQVCW